MIKCARVQDEQTVFVFNKAWFKQGAGPPEESAPDIRAQLPTQEQSLSSSSTIINNLTNKANQDGVEPMQNAVLDFLTRFVHWKSMAEAYASAARSRVRMCEQLQAEIAMQSRASVLAFASLERYYVRVREVVQKLEGEVREASDLMLQDLSYQKVSFQP